jgi:hypothetical protein
MHTRYLRLFAFVAILLMGCQSEEEKAALREAYLQQQLDNRIIEFRQLLDNQCRESALTEASRLADSILILEARLSLDTTGRPLRPDKPERPELKTLLDSTAVKPFFRDSLLKKN